MGCDKVDACQLVTRSIAESDAAWGATGNRGRHRQERRLSAPIYAKKGHPLEMSFSIKVAMTYSPTNVCSTIGAVGLNFSVRNGKRWIPDAINRLNICRKTMTMYRKKDRTHYTTVNNKHQTSRKRKAEQAVRYASKLMATGTFSPAQTEAFGQLVLLD